MERLAKRPIYLDQHEHYEDQITIALVKVNRSLRSPFHSGAASAYDKLKEGLIKLLFVDTVKRLRIKAQRCRASRLRWEEDGNTGQPQRGCAVIGDE